ncbi:hypothetical protein BC936DRAFT_147936 [Jimgerdemannia flammicorona]|uniref:Uncharacterized protein n=1 Tax=Jimgerdemannia flammicorona TaxID=994334 RepID=A0A433DN86_9FUNG|nr:hypothetical protein BC936DRAFT_147936 [Jimgerdemannia flammicorona]
MTNDPTIQGFSEPGLSYRIFLITLLQPSFPRFLETHSSIPLFHNSTSTKHCCPLTKAKHRVNLLLRAIYPTSPRATDGTPHTHVIVVANIVQPKLPLLQGVIRRYYPTCNVIAPKKTLWAITYINRFGAPYFGGQQLWKINGIRYVDKVGFVG